MLPQSISSIIFYKMLYVSCLNSIFFWIFCKFEYNLPRLNLNLYKFGHYGLDLSWHQYIAAANFLDFEKFRKFFLQVSCRQRIN